MSHETEPVKRGITRKQVKRYTIAHVARHSSIDIVVGNYDRMMERIKNILLNPNDDTIKQIIAEAEKEQAKKINS